MRILLLTQIVPYPPDSGPKIKTYHLLRALARDHDVHLVAFARSDVERVHAQSLAALCQSVTVVPLQRSRTRDVGYLVRSALSGRPFLIERDDSRAMHHAVAAVMQRHVIDAVHADQLAMAQFAVDLPVRLRVLDEHNAVWTIVRRAARTYPAPQRLLAEWEWRRLRRYERAICQRFDHVTVVSPGDADSLGLVEPSRSATVIPIAIDTAALSFEPRGATARDVLSVATMFYPPNVDGVGWFARAIFPTVRQACPDSQFHIVGSRPPASIQRLATASSGITVAGYVTDLDPYLRRSAVLVVPLRSGSGMRVKILEAFARGLPVVSTTIGAEGIDAVPGEHLLIADTPPAFAAAVTRLLHEPAAAARLAHAGRALVEARYDWRTALGQLDDLYATPAARDRRPRLATAPATR